MKTSVHFYEKVYVKITKTKEYVMIYSQIILIAQKLFCYGTLRISCNFIIRN